MKVKHQTAGNRNLSKVLIYKSLYHYASRAKLYEFQEKMGKSLSVQTIPPIN